MSNKHGSSYALQHPEHNGFSEQHNFTIVLVTAIIIEGNHLMM